MTQQRVFVTYSPVPSRARKGIARRLGRASQPVAAVVAGALAVGGAIHFGIPQRVEGEARRPATVGLGRHDKPEGGASARPLPYLAVVTFKPPTTWEPKAPQAAAPKAHKAAAPPSPTAAAPPVAPVASPRRDLAGFLADHGLSLQEQQLSSGPSADLPDDPSVEPVALAETTATSEQAPLTVGAAGAVGTVAALVESQDPPPAMAPTAVTELQTFPMVAVAGEALGAVTMRGDKIHLASLVGLLELKMPAGEFERLKAAPAADSFVDLDTLQAAGISATIDPAGETITLAAQTAP